MSKIERNEKYDPVYQEASKAADQQVIMLLIILLIYTHYLLQGTVYKGQLRQLVEFWKNIRDGLLFFAKMKGQDTINQGTKD